MIVSTRVCDLCHMDGDGNTKPIGWYLDAEGKHRDVCQKHGNDVKDAGLTLHEEVYEDNY